MTTTSTSRHSFADTACHFGHGHSFPGHFFADSRGGRRTIALSGDGPEGVARGLVDVRRRIESAGVDPAGVRVVAVTKGFGSQAVADALEAGLADIGENYAQEMLAKHAALGPTATRARWHFVGAIQRNKVRSLSPIVDCWQSVARRVEGEQIARLGPRAAVLVEIDTTSSPGRNGCSSDEAPALIEELAAMGLRVGGLMTVAPRGDEAADRAFRTVRELADRLGLEERSMGMSDDLERAVREGSTMVRIGRALFGDRPPRPAAR